MKYTQNYKMKLPEQPDKINIDDLNDNTKTIDAKIDELENKTATVTLSVQVERLHFIMELHQAFHIS